MLRALRIDTYDPPYYVYGSDVSWLVSASGRYNFSMEQIYSGPKPVNFGCRSVYGDTNVTHTHLDGDLFPPLEGLSDASSYSYWKIPIISAAPDPYWYPIPGYQRKYGLQKWYQLEENPSELTLNPMDGVQVLKVWRLTTAYYAYCQSYPWGWRPHSYVASYILWCKDSKGRYYQSGMTAYPEYIGQAIYQESPAVPPCSVLFQLCRYSKTTMQVRTYDWNSSPTPRVSARSAKINTGILFSAGLRIMDDERTRLGPTILSDARSDCAYSICEQAKNLDINSIAYIADIAKLAMDVKSGKVLESLGNLTKADSFTKKVNASASAYLSSKYGIRLTASDTQAIGDSIRNLLNHASRYYSARSMFTYSLPTTNPLFGSVLTVEEHYKCVYDPLSPGLRNLVSRLYRWDAFLSLENVWDLIPYSFVVDWVLPIGDYLNQYDDSILSRSLPIVGVTHSSKTGVVIPQNVLGWCSNYIGEVTLTQYTRSIESTLPPIIPSFSGLKKFNNVLEFGAIILQKLAR